MSYFLNITLTNEDEGHTFYSEREPIEDWLLDDDDEPDFGAIFRLLQREYGRCDSSVYVDTASGPPKRIGWFFLSRQRYDLRESYGYPTSRKNSYLRGAWVTVAREVEPARPASYESVVLP
jgi:hypothetical protein